MAADRYKFVSVKNLENKSKEFFKMVVSPRDINEG